MCVESLIYTFNVIYREIIYSVQGGLRVRTGVWANALNSHKNFFLLIYKFRFYGNGL